MSGSRAAARSPRRLRGVVSSNYGWNRMLFHRCSRSSQVGPLLATASLAIAAAAALPSAAAAEEQPVAVLTVQTLDAFEQADSFSAALRLVIEDQAGWRTAQLDKDYALLVLVNTLGCTDPPDAACEEKIAAELKVERFVWGNMRLEGADVVGDLHFSVRGQPSKAVPFRYPANLKTSGDDTLLGIARSTFVELAGGATKAKLTVKAGTGAGAVLVDGKEVGQLSNGALTIEVEPGSRKITVKVPGFADSEAVVDVEPREVRDVTLSPQEPSESADPQIIIGFVTLGLGAVAAGVGAYGGILALQLNGSEYEPHRKALTGSPKFAESEQGCPAQGNEAFDQQELEDFCSGEKTAELLQSVLYPTAGALGLTGVILLATADWGGPESASARLPVRVVPFVGRDHAFITITTSLD